MSDSELLALTQQNVETIFQSAFLCYLSTDKKNNPNPDPETTLTIAGITAHFCFDRAKIPDVQPQVDYWLSQLHPTFYKGWSFLNFSLKQDQSSWTEDSTIMEHLMVLGMAIGKVKFCSEFREHWKALPGKMPYIKILASQ